MAAKPAGSQQQSVTDRALEAGDHEVRDFAGPAAVVSPAQSRGHVIAHALEVREDRRRKRPAARQRGLEQADRLHGAHHGRDLGLAQHARPFRPAAMWRPQRAAGPAGR